jgi:hypothetical protein
MARLAGIPPNLTIGDASSTAAVFQQCLGHEFKIVGSTRSDWLAEIVVESVTRPSWRNNLDCSEFFASLAARMYSQMNMRGIGAESSAQAGMSPLITLTIPNKRLKP